MTGNLRQCVILVGGAGTRLGEIARDIPKPLLPVAGRPFLEWLLIKAARHGFDRVLLLAGHKAEAVDAYLAHGIAAKLGLTIGVSLEPSPLGTGGALAQALDRLDPAFLMVNGDTWYDFDWRALANIEGFDAVLALRPMDDPDRYETVALSGATVTGFHARGAAGPALINGGAYRLTQTVADTIAAPASLERDVLPRLAEQGRLGGVIFDAPFIDIGIPADYAAASALISGAETLFPPSPDQNCPR
jgi:D-glycero-alpha-D-manno-heptose 1-phosphate guanylyltransferase